MKLSFEEEGKVFLFDKSQAYLFVYSGELACYNHVYLELPDEDGEPPTALYVWRDDEQFQRCAAHIIEHEFPAYVGLSELDEQTNMVFRWHMGLEELDAATSFPAEWVTHEPS